MRRGGRCRVSDSTPVSRSRTRWHRFTLTRLPEPSVLVPFGTDLAESSWGGPSSFGSSTTTPLPHITRGRCTTCCPKAPGHLPPEGGRRARSSRRTARRHRVAPLRRALQQVSVARVTRGWPQARSDPTSAPVSRDVCRLVVAPGLPKESDSPVRGGREHCPCSDSALASWTVWAGPKPPSSPPRSACALRNEHQ